MARIATALLATALLAGCVTPERGAVPPPVDRRPEASPPLHGTTGLASVMGRNARALIALFGDPGLDVREGPARKLQFLGLACVLDFYLYPPRRGDDPVVTHVDARRPDGDDMDRAACVEALSRR